MLQVEDEAGRQSAGIPYTLLPSKVRVPACRGDVVARTQVSAKLNRGLMCKLTSVVASAGYGKTTAVASWASGVGRGCAVAWYAVGTQDSAPGVFWRYVCAALGEADAELDRTLADLSFPDDPALLRNAISCLIVAAGALPRRVVLVLDDFHVVQDEPDIAQSVQYLLQNLPANMHLVVTSRRPLALQLARLRVAGQLMAIDENDLRFTADEAAEFFSRAGCVAPESPEAPAAACAFTSDGLARIEAYTHGWPAGCRLVAMLGDADDARGAHDQVRAGMNDYLFEEVFLALPADQRDFLVKTSVVDSFCPSLAAALTGMSCPQAAGMAEALARGDLFIARIDQGGSESWYRYHMLFADMLATRATALAPEELEGCRKAARDWYARHGYLDQAVSMCVALTDWDGLRDLVVANWKSLYMTDSHQTLVRWASQMPQARVLDSPFLCAVLAMPYAIAGQIELANSLVMHAVERLKPNEDFLFAMCMVQKAFLAACRARFADMRKFAESALEYLPQEEYYLRGMMFQVLASSYSSTEPLRSRALLHEALQMQESFGNRNLTCSALGNLAMSCANLGLYDESQMHADSALGLYSEAEGACKPMLAYAWLAQAIVAHQLGRFDQAERDLDAYRRLTDLQGGAPEMVAQACVLRAKVRVCRGDMPGAEAAFTRALNAGVAGAAQAFPGAVLVKPCAAVVKSRVDACLSAHDEHRGALRALAAVAAYCLGEAAPDMCEEYCAFAEGIDKGERALYIYANVVGAMLCEQAALTVRADACLARAASLAAQTGSPMLLAENVEALRPVAQRLLSTSRDMGVVACLSGLYEGAGTPGLSSEQASDARLTEREVDVMRLVAAGLSVAQAAEHMVVSRETVKKHLANIYAKLGVHSKMQAVALLRERGVL